jgi:hypothetical protein
MIKKISRALMIVFAVLIGLYPAVYFFIDRKFGLLSSKSDALLTNIFWNMGFYVHIVAGGIALLVGWIQFNTKFRNLRISLHRKIGKVYIVSVLLSSTAGIGIAFFATGGILSSLGFICLGLVWFCTTLKSYISIRKKQIEQHQKMMIYSYAACFAAVTLRIWLPLLTIGIGNFTTAYTLTAWLCWVPNIAAAYLISKRFGIKGQTLSKKKINTLKI